MAKNQKTVIKNAKCFCREPIENIEGYYEMIASDKKWCCHHRREISEKKSSQQLKDEGFYYKRPASDLVFMLDSEHKRLHNKNLRPETLKKISDSMKGEKCYWFGKHHSDETKRKISESRKGVTAGEKHPQARPVVQLTMDGQFVKEWSYAKEAKQYGFNNKNISTCCIGNRKSTGGYKWMFADEYYAQQQNPIVVQLDLFIHNVS